MRMNINIIFFLILFICFKKINSYSDGYLFHKYEKITTSNDYVIFASKDFEEGQMMTFKTDKYSNGDIKYFYFDGWENIGPNLFFDEINKGEYYRTETIRGSDCGYYYKECPGYFIITKDKKEFGETNGRYLYIEINSYDSYEYISTITISNIKEKNGKPEKWIMSIALIAFFLLFIFLYGMIKFCLEKY